MSIDEPANHPPNTNISSKLMPFGSRSGHSSRIGTHTHPANSDDACSASSSGDHAATGWYPRRTYSSAAADSTRNSVNARENAANGTRQPSPGPAIAPPIATRDSKTTQSKQQ